MKVTSPIADKIAARIKEMNAPCVFFITSFTDIASPDVVRKILKQMVEKGKITKITKGIYCKTQQTRFGALVASPEEVAKAIAVRDKVQIMPTGSAALNKLGLSSQVPLNVVYLTTGTARIVNLGEYGQITFRHSMPLNFAYQTELVSLLVQALREVCVEDLNAEEYTRLCDIIQMCQQDEKAMRDIEITPQNIQKVIKRIIKQNNYIS